MPFDRQFAHVSPTGATLNVYARSPSGVTRAIIQVNHGLAEHAARYARLADILAGHGYATYAHDHRGHGQTHAADAPRGVFAAENGAEKVIADVIAVRDRIAEEQPGVPVVLFGHSMGGLIALNVLLRHHERYAAAAIWNANFSAGAAGQLAQLVLAWERFRLGSDVPSRLLPALTFRAWAKQIPERRTEFDWLSRDPVEVDKYIADPLCGFDASVSLWRDVFSLVFYGADDASFTSLPKDYPVAVVGGDKDPATDGGKAVRTLERRMRAMGFSNLQTTIYEATRHESLNEVNREKVMGDLADWLDRTTKAS